jgi:hypothetical protein
MHPLAVEEFLAKQVGVDVDKDALEQICHETSTSDHRAYSSQMSRAGNSLRSISSSPFR